MKKKYQADSFKVWFALSAGGVVYPSTAAATRKECLAACTHYVVKPKPVRFKLIPAKPGERFVRKKK